MAYKKGMENRYAEKPLSQNVLTEKDLFCWVISDTHFFHDNIVQYAKRPENHDEIMRARWEEAVREEDSLLHLGDLAFGREERLKELANLPGQKTLLLGNHDRRNPRRYLEIGFKVIKKGFSVPWRDWTIHFVHDPTDAPGLYPKHLVLHGHIHEKNYADPRYVNLSVEQIDYRPIWLPDLLDEKIAGLTR